MYSIRELSFQDLWRSRRSLKYIEDFDHTIVNETLGACGDLPSLQEGPCLPYFIWQCGEAKVTMLVLGLWNFDIDICADLFLWNLGGDVWWNLLKIFFNTHDRSLVRYILSWSSIFMILFRLALREKRYSFPFPSFIFRVCCKMVVGWLDSSDNSRNYFNF